MNCGLTSKCTAPKTTGLLSFLQMKIMSSEWAETKCNVWERCSSRSQGAILSLLRWMMLLREESACQSWTCHSTGNGLSQNDSSCCSIQNNACCSCMQRSARHSRHAAQTSVSQQWFVALLSNLLHCLCMMGPVWTGPACWGALLPWIESRTNESCVRMLHAGPVLGIASCLPMNASQTECHANFRRQWVWNTSTLRQEKHKMQMTHAWGDGNTCDAQENMTKCSRKKTKMESQAAKINDCVHQLESLQPDL